jgi:hypothetical protein
MPAKRAKQPSAPQPSYVRSPPEANQSEKASNFSKARRCALSVKTSELGFGNQPKPLVPRYWHRKIFTAGPEYRQHRHGQRARVLTTDAHTSPNRDTSSRAGQADLADRRRFLRHLAPVKKKRWVVYAKTPLTGPKAVLTYLSRYTYRVAISNRRPIAFDETGITFRYKD